MSAAEPVTDPAVREYDLVVLGSPTWWRTVSMPLRSFLESSEAAVLDGTPYAVFTVCRRYWRENLEAVRELADVPAARATAPSAAKRVGCWRTMRAKNAFCADASSVVPADDAE